MNGIHDMGGMHGFGPIVREENEPKYHAAWEARMQLLAHTGFYNLDEFRYGIERMDPVAYLAASYYERWLATAETNLIEKGVITREELDARHARFAAGPTLPVLRNDDATITAQARARRIPTEPPDPDPPPPHFAEGDVVRARNIHPVGHTRLPRYARGKPGTVVAVRGRMILPDTHIGGTAGEWQWVYTVRFAAHELWGGTADANGCIHIDLWETYLDPA